MRLAILMLAPWGFQCSDYTHAYDTDVSSVRAAWDLTEDACNDPRVELRTFVCDATCSSGFYIAGSDTLLIRDGMSDTDTRAAVRHEAVHWISSCTGYQPFGDPGHSMPELWGAGGVLERATP